MCASRSTPYERRSRHGWRIAVPALVAAAVLAPGASALAAPAASVVVSGPTAVPVGSRFFLTVDAVGATRLGGYQLDLGLDARHGRFSAVRQRHDGLATAGRSVQPLGPVGAGRTAHLGAYSCAAERCVRSHGREPVVSGSRVRLARVEVVARRTGALRV